MRNISFSRRQAIKLPLIAAAATLTSCDKSAHYHLPSSALASTPSPAPFAYTFADEFDGLLGAAPDPSKWTYDLGDGGWGSGELEVYTDSRVNSYLDGNSHLIIAATKTGNVYNSARIKTEGIFAQLGGHFEAKIKINSQPGLWPAFWLVGQDIQAVGWPRCGEVDILESYGRIPDFIETTVHTADGISAYKRQKGIASDDDWHIYRFDWEEDKFIFFCDGIAYFVVDKSDFPADSWVYGPESPNNGGMFLVLNLAVGGYAGKPSPTSWPVELMVDYVHVWK